MNIKKLGGENTKLEHISYIDKLHICDYYNTDPIVKNLNKLNLDNLKPIKHLVMNNASIKGIEEYKCPEILENSVERITIWFRSNKLKTYKPQLTLFLAQWFLNLRKIDYVIQWAQGAEVINWLTQIKSRAKQQRLYNSKDEEIVEEFIINPNNQHKWTFSTQFTAKINKILYLIKKDLWYSIRDKISDKDMEKAEMGMKMQEPKIQFFSESLIKFRTISGK